jgi:hypothetical protein
MQAPRDQGSLAFLIAWAARRPPVRAGRQADLAAGTVGAVAMIDSIGIGADVARRDELLRQL